MTGEDMEAAEVRVTQVMATTCLSATDYAVFGLAGRLAVAETQGLSHTDRIVALTYIEEFFKGLRDRVAQTPRYVQDGLAGGPPAQRTVVDYGFDHGDD